ncbi:MAG: flagellar hook-basal body complex protein FliE [Alphaproteobacteria bacterium]|nr:flagellar hook-basal body complex protein FliE [Alphaproteobacteria bacterium]
MSAISGITNLQSITASQQSAVGKAETIKDNLAGQTGPDITGASFTKRLQESLNSVAQAQKDAAQSVVDYETGKHNDLTKVMVDQQISSIGFQMTLNIRNKALSAYKEIMNMPV